jgi:hypothetical protein
MNKYQELKRLIDEIVSTEVEKLSGGGPDVQKNQDGFGNLGNQKDTKKQERNNDKALYFTSSNSESEESEESEGSEENNQN